MVIELTALNTDFAFTNRIAATPTFVRLTRYDISQLSDSPNLVFLFLYARYKASIAISTAIISNAVINIQIANEGSFVTVVVF